MPSPFNAAYAATEEAEMGSFGDRTTDSFNEQINTVKMVLVSARTNQELLERNAMIMKGTYDHACILGLSLSPAWAFIFTGLFHAAIAAAGGTGGVRDTERHVRCARQAGRQAKL